MSRGNGGDSILARQKKPALMLLILFTSMLLPNATAHELMDFSMMLKDEGPVPSNIGAGIIFEGDGVFFRHVANNTTTITVAVDMDEDGVYDIQSSNLSRECELDESGNKTNPNCEVTFRIDFTAGEAGNYSFLVNSSTGENWTGSFVISIDTHADPDSPIGYSNLQNDDSEGVEEINDPITFKQNIAKLLLFIGVFCVVFVILGIVESEETRDEDSHLGEDEEE